jgi:hypothetical protein
MLNECCALKVTVESAEGDGTTDSVADLPTHLAHPVKDDGAVMIHSLRPSLQGSRQNRGELC